MNRKRSEKERREKKNPLNYEKAIFKMSARDFLGMKLGLVGVFQSKYLSVFQACGKY